MPSSGRPPAGFEPCLHAARPARLRALPRGAPSLPAVRARSGEQPFQDAAGSTMANASASRTPNGTRAAADRSPCAHHVAAPGAPGMSPPPGVPGIPDHPGAHEATAGWRGDGPSRQSPGWSCSLLCAGWSFRGRRRQWPAAQGRAWTARRADRRSAIAGPGAVEVTTQAQSQPRWRPSGQVRRGTRAPGGSRPESLGFANHEQAGTRAIAIGAAKWSIAWRDPGRPNWLICARLGTPTRARRAARIRSA